MIIVNSSEGVIAGRRVAGKTSDEEDIKSEGEDITIGENNNIRHVPIVVEHGNQGRKMNNISTTRTIPHNITTPDNIDTEDIFDDMMHLDKIEDVVRTWMMRTRENTGDNSCRIIKKNDSNRRSFSDISQVIHFKVRSHKEAHRGLIMGPVKYQKNSRFWKKLDRMFQSSIIFIGCELYRMTRKVPKKL